MDSPSRTGGSPNALLVNDGDSSIPPAPNLDAAPNSQIRQGHDLILTITPLAKSDHDLPPIAPSHSDARLPQLQPDSILPPSFTLFPLLPKEIRLEIWELSHPPPRNVIIDVPTNPKARNWIPGWQARWIFPALPMSKFATLLVNHEARTCFLAHYQVIFPYISRLEEEKQGGKKGGWYFNPKVDSLCFADGVKGLRRFMIRFHKEDFWSYTRYIDVSVDMGTFAFDEPIDGYMMTSNESALCLAKMKELKLVTLRVISVRGNQWKPRWNGRWKSWENQANILKDWLMGTAEVKSGVKLAMQYAWTEGVVEWEKDFLDQYPGASDDIRKRWVEMGIYLQDGRHATQTIYDTKEVIFCRNLEIELHKTPQEGENTVT